VFSSQIFQENTFLETQPNFSLTRKCFSLTNFSNGKQTQQSLTSSFLKTIFQKTNIPLKLLYGIAGHACLIFFFLKKFLYALANKAGVEDLKSLQRI